MREIGKVAVVAVTQVGHSGCGRETGYGCDCVGVRERFGIFLYAFYFVQSCRLVSSRGSFTEVILSMVIACWSGRLRFSSSVICRVYVLLVIALRYRGRSRTRVESRPRDIERASVTSLGTSCVFVMVVVTAELQSWIWFCNLF